MLGTFIKASWDLLSTFIGPSRDSSGPQGLLLSTFIRPQGLLSREKRRCQLPLPLRESHLAKIIILALSGKFLFNLPAACKQFA